MPPSPDQIALTRAKRIYLVSITLAALCGGIGIGATAFVIRYSDKVSDAQGAQIRQLERDRDVARTDAIKAEARIAEANSRGEQARQEAAQANERTAALELQVEQERKERLRLDATVEKILPRSLLISQANIIRARLLLSRLSSVSIKVSHDGACADCALYARQISELLASIGMSVQPGMVFGSSIRAPGGLALGVLDPTHLSTAANSLIAAFMQAGIAFDVVQDDPRGRPPGIIGMPQMEWPELTITVMAVAFPH